MILIGDGRGYNSVQELTEEFLFILITHKKKSSYLVIEQEGNSLGALKKFWELNAVCQIVKLIKLGFMWCRMAAKKTLITFFLSL